MRPEESELLPRFFLQAGYMLPVTEQDAGWGAWLHGELVGAVALTRMQGGWLLRGPEIVSAHRHQGIGPALLDFALPDIRSLECYVAVYSYLTHIYARVGFSVCPHREMPEYFAQQIALARRTQWDLILMRRLPSPG